MQLMEYTKADMDALLATWREPAYRAGQVWEWLQKGVRPADMTNLPRRLRDRLSEMPFGGCRIEARLRSAIDDTEKLLFALEDGNLVEGVWMQNAYGNTVCLSTQVGCKMGCRFCASTLEGCVRNLSQGEMYAFLTEMERLYADRATGGRAVTNIVLMGSGEPLDNYAQVRAFLLRATAADGLNISVRNISLSTCGIVPMIHRLIEEGPHITLCISLHAHDDRTRDSLMPINAVYPIAQVVAAAKAYAESTGRRVIFEYALMQDVNAAKEDALTLARLLRGINCHVNLIPLNDVKERSLRGVTREYANTFSAWLNDAHISATVRREMGADIEGACGQLRRRVLDEHRLDQ